MSRLQRVLVTIVGVLGVVGASIVPATAATGAAPAQLDTHDCQFIIIYANCPGADPDWYWICQTYHGGIEIHNDCDVFLTRD